jgi:starch-binding outer membrane protein, SusD/RagB family
MKKIIILILLTMCSTLSCKKFLETTPEDFVSPENYFNTEQELQRALNGVYNRLIDTFGRLYQRGLWSYLAVSDEFFYSNITSNNLKVMDFDQSNLDVSRFWEVSYQGIDRANQVIENAGKPVMDEAKRNSIKGQALFLRAYYHFLLVTNFGDIPLKLKPTSSPTDQPLPRSPIAEVYAQIVKDMKEAETLCAPITGVASNEVVSKTAVQAILARVYLKMAGAPLKDVSKYQDALTYANKVISSGSHSLNPDYKQIFINHSQDITEPKECIWEIGMYGNQQGTEQIAGSVGIDNGILSSDNEIGFSAGTMRVTKRIYDLYKTGDLRRDWAISPFYYKTTGTVTVATNYTATQIYDRNIGKWRRSYELLVPKHRTYNSTNFPVIRYADVLLMKAEAENEVNGPTAQAYEAINQVRRRGYGKPLTTVDVVADITPGLSKPAFLAEVQNERAKELAFEGMRKHDLIRWDLYLTNMASLIPEVVATAPATWQRANIAAKNITARNLLLPIPAGELISNPNIKQQNPGWN